MGGLFGTFSKVEFVGLVGNFREETPADIGKEHLGARLVRIFDKGVSKGNDEEQFEYWVCVETEGIKKMRSRG